MPSYLKDMEIDEVSLVPDGANPGAKVLFYKSREEKKMDKSTLLDQVKKLFGANAADHLQKGMYKDPSMKKEDEGTAEESSVMDEKMDMLYDSVESISGDAQLTPADKRKMMEKTFMQFIDDVLPTTVEDTPTEKADPVTDETSKDEDMKNDEVAKALESKIAKLQADYETKIAKANEQITKMQEEKADADRLAKATKMVAGLPLKAESVAKILKSSDAETIVELEKTLATTAAALKESGIFKEIGSNNGQSDESAMDKLNKIASDIRKSNVKLTEAQAFREAVRQNPGLFQETRQSAN